MAVTAVVIATDAAERRVADTSKLNQVVLLARKAGQGRRVGAVQEAKATCGQPLLDPQVEVVRMGSAEMVELGIASL